MKTRTITIDVTDDDIDRGIDCKVTDCPVAIAASRALPLCYIMSCLDYLKLRRLDKEELTILPWPTGQIEAFIRGFDLWKRSGYPRPEAFTFQMEIPERFLGCEPQRPRGSEVPMSLASTDT